MSGFDIAVLIVAVLAILVLLAIAGRFQRITIFEYQRGLKFRGGRGPDLLEPGQYWIFRPTTFVHVIDTREQFMSVAGQELVTSDSVSLKLSVLVRYRVADPQVAFLQVSDYLGALYSVVQIGLREAISVRSVDDVLEKRDEIATEVVQRVTDKVRTLGVELVSIHVRDLMFPGPLKKTFGQVLEAKQQGSRRWRRLAARLPPCAAWLTPRAWSRRTRRCFSYDSSSSSSRRAATQSS
jgi:regulator of protease activity HflC (stomatin/prohibitin superfamily)